MIRRRIVPTVVGLLLSMAALFIVGAIGARAASEAWARPINISHSGVATNPHIFVDGKGDMVGYWPESITSGVSRGTATSAVVEWDGSQWSDPVLTELPFAPQPHAILAGRGTTMRVFWLSQVGDLQFKTATTATMGSVATWNAPATLANSVLAFDVVSDSEDKLHLAYISASDDPTAVPGAYYRQSSNGGATWTSPKLIYRSDYFRQFITTSTLPAQSLQDSASKPSIDLTASVSGGESRAVVSWTNPGLKRMYLATADSRNAETWSVPLQIAKPDLQDPYTTPSDPSLYLLENRILLVAKDVRDGGSCSTFMQQSTDNGATWSSVQSPPILSSFCPSQLDYLGTQDGSDVFSFLAAQGDVVLIALKDGLWSQPQVQTGLARFQNPDTYSPVQLGCPDLQLEDSRVFLLACDTAGGGDIWFTSLMLGDPSAWFSVPEGWESMGTKDIGSDPTNSFDIVSDAEGSIHSVGAHTDRLSDGSLSSTIDYFGTERGDVVGPFPILQKIKGRVDQTRLVVSDNDQITMIWRSGEEGSLSYSSTQAQKGSSGSGWVRAQLITGADPIGSDPSLATDQSGLVASYVVPFNEGRGVYFISWDGDTQTWNKPVKVFDGVTAGCPSVNSPTIGFGSPNVLHLVWLCKSLPGGEGAYEVLYTNSVDGGVTWSNPVQSWNVPARWATLEALPDGSVHIFWELVGADGFSTWHSMSRDGGKTWGAPINFDFHVGIEGPEGKVVPAGLSSFFFLQPFQSQTGSPALGVWYWNGNGWQQLPELELQASQLSQLEGWGATLTLNKKLVAGYVVGNGEPFSSKTFDQQIAFAQLQADLPEVTLPKPEVSPTPSSTVASTPTLTPLPDSQSVKATPPSSGNSPGPSGLSRGILSPALGLVLGLVLVVGVIMLWRRSRSGPEA